MHRQGGGLKNKVQMWIWEGIKMTDWHSLIYTNLNIGKTVKKIRVIFTPTTSTYFKSNYCTHFLSVMFLVSKEKSKRFFSAFLKHHINKYLMFHLFSVQHVCRRRHKKYLIYNSLFQCLFVFPSLSVLFFCSIFSLKVLSRLLDRLCIETNILQYILL